MKGCRANEHAAKCPCGSDKAYAACCGPCHDGSRAAVSAEALMRSRYSAYALQLGGYLLDTWHPDTRPSELGRLDDCKWIRLQIGERAAGGPNDRTGVVAFTAYYTRNGRAARVSERSRFARLDGRWVYVDAAPDTSDS